MWPTGDRKVLQEKSIWAYSRYKLFYFINKLRYKTLH